MSLDLTLSPPKCETCGHDPEGISFNITYNLSPMWYHLYPDDTAMLSIEGQTGLESSVIITLAISAFIRKRKDLIPLNPPNGYGSYDGFLKALSAMRNACEEHPDWIWSADR